MTAGEELETAFPSLDGRGPTQLRDAMTALGPPGAAWLRYAHALMTDGRLRPSLRELVILRVAWLHRSAYVWGGHVLIGGDVGLVMDPAVAWAAEERLAIAVVDQLLESGRLGDPTRALAIRQWDPNELLELVMVIGQYQTLSLAGRVLQFRAEPGCPSLPSSWPGPRPSDDDE